MQDIQVRLQNISVAYGQQQVLSNISHTFEAGRITAILGRSGSGKSTLLSSINGLSVPQQGHIYLGETLLTPANTRQLRLQMGFVIQHTGLFPHLNIAQNIAMPGHITGMDKQAQMQRVQELMHISLLPQAYQFKYPHQLSGGEQQRAGLCRALFLNPPLLLMDEPFASLDYVTKQSLYTYMLDLQQKQARTVMIVTHDLDEALRIADDFVWIEKGNVREKGDKEKLKAIRAAYLAG